MFTMTARLVKYHHQSYTLRFLLTRAIGCDTMVAIGPISRIGAEPMVVNLQADRRPYAAPANVVGFIKRARTRNLPDSIDNDFLRLAEIPEAVFGRVMEALCFLDFIHDDGTVTDRLIALSAAPDEEAKDLLAAAIREAYRDDFERIDPERDSQSQIVSAFQRYQPRSQTARMVMLLLGLCREAGIPVKDAPRERKMQGASSRTKPKTKEKASRRRNSRRSEPDAHEGVDGLVFGVTEDDIAHLDDEMFEEVWGALGKLARVRAQARQRGKDADESESEPDPVEQATD